jgi:hypothetical protein
MKEKIKNQESPAILTGTGEDNKEVGQAPKKFPFVEIYPESFVALINALQRTSGFPQDFTAAAILVACGTAIGNSVEVRRNATHTERAMLYCIAVGPPNSCKSHPIRYALDFFHQLDKNHHLEYEKAKQQFEEQENKSQEERLKAGLQPLPKPTLKTIIVNDFTIESLLLLLRNNQKGILIYSDEILGWLKNLNKYNKGSDIEHYTSMWSGQSVYVHRKLADPLFVERPFVSIIGSIQTKLLDKLSKNDCLENGFSDRVLWVMPQDLPITKWKDESVDPQLEDAYVKAIEKLYQLPTPTDNGKVTPHTLEFTQEAKDRLIEWRNGSHWEELNKKQGEAIATALGKFDIMALRFSLILQLMYWATGELPMDNVGCRAVEGAILLTDYFKENTDRMQQFVLKKDTRLLMSKLQRKVYDSLPKSFARKVGVEIAARYGMSRDQLKRFVARKEFFSKTDYGEYEKVINEDE